MKNLYLCQKLCAVFCLGLVAASMTSCSGSSSDGASGDGETSAISKQYHVVDNGCDSGVQAFSGSSEDQVNQAYCKGLQDENRNRDHSPQKATVNGNYCPSSSREALFKINCPGTFNSHFLDPTQSTGSQPTSSQANSDPVTGTPKTGTAADPAPSNPKNDRNQIPTKIKNANSLEEIVKILAIDQEQQPYQMSAELLKSIGLALKAKLSIIENSRNVSAQKSFLYYVEYRLSLYSDVLDPVCVSFMKSPDEELRTEAAAIEIGTHPENAEAIAIIRAGTSSKSVGVRNESISALAGYSRMTQNDRMVIVGAIGDPDQNIDYTAASAADDMKLGAEFVPLLSKLMTYKNPSVRSNAASLLGKIPGSQVSEILISYLNDPDQNVQYTVDSILSDRKLSSIELDALLKILDCDQANARSNAASLIGKIEGQKATDILISHMNDKDQNVSYAITSILDDRPVNESNLATLSIEIKASQASTRSNACSLVGKIAGSQATVLLLSRLSDSDPNVRYAAASILDDRPMKEENLPALVEQLNSTEPSARSEAASLISKLGSADGKAALKKRLQVEKDPNVSYAIQSSLDN